MVHGELGSDNLNMDMIRDFSILLLVASIQIRLSSSSGKQGGVCVSKGGRFPPFSIEGRPPRKVNRGSNDLTLCRVFRKRTCCDVTQTYPAFLSIRNLATRGEASQECLHLWELLECSICDPSVGVQPGSPLICDTFCNRAFDACHNAYFSMNERKRVLEPCGPNDFVCGKASEWVSNGTELCRAASFSVKTTRDAVRDVEHSCYGDKESFEAVSKSWMGYQFDAAEKDDEAENMLDELNQWIVDMPFSRKVAWAACSVVITSGLFLASKRRSYRNRQKLAVIKRTAKKLEGRNSAKNGQRNLKFNQD